MLLQLFLGDLRVEFDMIDILLLCPEVLDDLEDCLEGLDDCLYAGPAQSFCVFCGSEVGVEMGVVEANVEGGLYGIDELPVVGEMLEGRSDLHLALLLLHQL